MILWLRWNIGTLAANLQQRGKICPVNTIAEIIDFLIAEKR